MYATRFHGQTAIITGGADGIGKAIAWRLAGEGASVTLFDVDSQMLERTKSEFKSALFDVDTVCVDVSSEKQACEAIQQVCRDRSRIDVVVHCAGIVGPNGAPIVDVDVADFDRVYEINVRGTFSVIKHALVEMRKSNYGRILVFSSIAGKEGNAGMCAYSSAKAAVIGLVKSVGKEFAHTNITVNAIAPAVVRTALVERMDPQQVKYMTDKIPMKRCGTLDEITSLSCWIVSKEAGFNTGFTFDLSGGRATY
jgi:3-oxoacyl-[acyl-carrier protein] reductase